MPDAPTFQTLPLSPTLQPGLEALGYTEMTPIQAQALPAILDGRDDARRAALIKARLTEWKSVRNG